MTRVGNSAFAEAAALVRRDGSIKHVCRARTTCCRACRLMAYCIAIWRWIAALDMQESLARNQRSFWRADAPA